ncbi:putative nuclease HARBI1 isoform X2 [Diorhabda carinulata]|uniref:putative nuclease HARBI1 isoform X2 n=1 Tax=Diorhabda carinulata TaxID=1163345 RepID=UPI0025A0043A|nr:putative nuclease HARBI1 isoform X2 [Diorhabda carinulata]
MKVKVAAQTLSRTVSVYLYNLVQQNILPPRSLATATFIQEMDELFDSLNASARVAPDGKPFKCIVSEESGHTSFWEDAFRRVNQYKFIRSIEIAGTSFPCTKGEWEKIAKEFENKWNFPYTIGAIDDKHIVIEAPPNAGSYYFNYKGTHSIVLFALADANYNFLYIDVGCNGRISDGGIFKNCTLNQALQEATLNLPPDKCLPNRIKPVPYVMLGDEAFALSKNLLKPFPRNRPLNAKQKVFNYRLCRARRVVENAFGILTSRFRIFRKPICLKVETIDKIVLTACVLHNFLKKQCQEVTLNYELEDIPTSMRGIAHQGSNNASEVAHSIRNEFAEYFYNEGQIDFQWKHI